MLIWLGVGGGVWASDRLTKVMAGSWGWSQLNQGGVLGIGRGISWQVVMIVAIVGLGVYWLRVRERERGVLVIIMAAGLANLCDRWWYGGVWDWIHYPVIGVVGNLADVWLVVGVIILLGYNLKGKSNNGKQ